MNNRLVKNLLTACAAALLSACLGAQLAPIPVDQGSVEPGTGITRGGTPLTLLGNPIAVGEKLPSVPLIDSNLKQVDLSRQTGSVLFLNIVPSLDTGVCERQTHYLGEEGDKLPEGVRRITISRDLPFAQKRFAEAADLTDIWYLSDYREAAFGKSTGLLINELALLARSVILVDRSGTVRYIQVVPELGHLPDLEEAFARAAKLADEG